MAVHSYTTRIYDALGPAVHSEDPDRLWENWLDGVGHLLGRVDSIVADSDDGPGWSKLLDVDRAETEGLAWLASLVGVTLSEAGDAERRQAIRDRASQKRGIPQAIIAAAQRTLTGTQKVTLTERDGGNAYRLRVTTYAPETPDSAVTEAAIRAAKPAGLILSYAALTGQTWGNVLTRYATWQDVLNAHGTWQSLIDQAPL